MVREMFEGVIELDPCSNEHSLVDAVYEFQLPLSNGLKEPWHYRTIFVNPPYGRSYLHPSCNSLADNLGDGVFRCSQCCTLLSRKEVEGSSIADWVEECVVAHKLHAAEVIALIPAAVGTAHFYDFVWHNATSVCFPKGRLKFGGEPLDGSSNVAPMDVCLPYWGLFPDRFERIFSSLGKVVQLGVR
jgi:hypothetical protein